MKLRAPAASALAAAFLEDGPWTPDGLRERGAAVFASPSNARTPWFSRVVARVHAAYQRAPRDAPGALAALIADAAKAEAESPGEEGDASDADEPASSHDDDRERYETPPSIARYPIVAPQMANSRRFDVPSLTTLRELAAFVGLPHEWLDWFADARATAHSAPEGALQHYRWRWVAKRGRQTLGVRLLATPKPTLRAAQRRVLRGILDAVPAHEAAHGFRRGRSTASFAAPHAGRDVVVRLDLADFFVSIRRARVRALFRALGYPEQVSATLAALCTAAPPRETLAALSPDAHLARLRHRSPHLPQGAPTSPALANLCAFGLDVRLHAAAASVSATYTRYADDLAFSGDARFARRSGSFVTLVAAIAQAEGFAVRFDKTRVMRRGARQQLGGLVVNEAPVPPRESIERLESTLINCLRRGAHTQNRDALPDFRAHLLGRVAQVAQHHATRGERLRALLEAIDWSR